MKSHTMKNMSYLENPIKLLHRLKEAGFTQSQAEVQVEVLSSIENDLVTKKDLKSELRELELRMTIKTATIVATIVGFFSILEKFF